MSVSSECNEDFKVRFFEWAKRSPDRIDPIDAIIVFTGYGLELCDQAAKLYKQQAKKIPIHIFGPDSLNQNPFSNNTLDEKLNAEKYKEEVLKLLKSNDVAPNVCAYSQKSETQFTHKQAEKAAKIADEQKWQNLALITASYHQPRAYMTFLQAMNPKGLDIIIPKIIPFPYDQPRNWKESDCRMWQKRILTWTDALEGCGEKQKIAEYQKKKPPHVCSWPTLNKYLSHHFPKHF